MNMVILNIYKYFLDVKNDYEAFNVVKFIEKYSISKGKLFCWHDWQQFEVHPDGWNFMINGTKARCRKCGKIGFKHRVDYDERLMDCSRHVTYM